MTGELSESSIGRFVTLVMPCLEPFPFVSTFLSSRFHTTLLHYFCVCFFLLLHSWCSHARGILCEDHTPFPIAHAKWSFKIMLCRIKKDCFKLTIKNNITRRIGPNYVSLWAKICHSEIFSGYLRPFQYFFFEFFIVQRKYI